MIDRRSWPFLLRLDSTLLSRSWQVSPRSRSVVLHTWPMTDEDYPTHRAGDQDAWTRIRGWSKKHQGPLLLLGFGFTAAGALVSRGRWAGNTGSVMESAVTAAEAATNAAAGASERVAREFQALGRDYNMAAMDQTVGQAMRRPLAVAA